MNFGVKFVLPVTDGRFDKSPFLPAKMCGVKTRKEYMLAPYNKIYEFVLPYNYIPKKAKDI